MKKLCAKQNRRAKQWEFSQSVRKLFAMCCEFRNAKNHSEFRNAKFRNAKNHIANFAMRKFANHIAKFAMRNFAKDFDAFVRQMNSVLWLQNFRNAKFAMRSWQTTFRNAKWLPTDCQLFAKIPALLFFSKYAPKFQKNY